MDNYIPNSNRNVTGIGKGSQISDEIKNAMPTGNAIDRNNQKNNRNTGSPPVLPWEISNIISNLGDVFVKILDVKTSVNNVRMNPALKQKQHKSIEEIQDILDNINVAVSRVTEKLDDLVLRD